MTLHLSLDRLAMLQSGIHGWGLIARTEMKQDSMIIEYRGEALRRCMADFRERIYRAKDMDCYLFNINDGVVVDATMKGTIGRFTVSPFPADSNQASYWIICRHPDPQCQNNNNQL